MNLEELKLFIEQALKDADKTVVATLVITSKADSGEWILVRFTNGKSFEIQIKEI